MPLETTYYDNGQKKFEIFIYENGNAIVTSWYENGKMALKGKCKDYLNRLFIIV
jgi:antitoxin component YwqK of YwqJK toxin-antitoxin module